MYTTSMCGPQALVAARLFWAPMAPEGGLMMESLIFETSAVRTLLGRRHHLETLHEQNWYLSWKF